MYFWSLLLIYIFIKNTMACPSNCICKWKGGKQTVECVNKSMITVPDGIDVGTQVLDFIGNNLKSLGSEQFQRLGLVNLQKIYLSRCRLTKLDDRTFKGLTNLVELDLSNNILPVVPVETFQDFPSLMKLNLNGNPLKIIKSYSFRNLKHLISIELSRCELEVIESDSFYGLAALEWLKLDYNLLKYIPGETTIPKKLHGINLQHNPWFCDCKLTDLYGWLNVTSIPHAIEPICNGPARLRGAPIKLLDEQELACLPDVSPTSLYLETSEGKNVTLLCRVNAIPEAKISWRFRDHVLQNDSLIAPGVHLYYYAEEGDVDKKSELFILNTNVEDNGTFICVAENQAGKAQSNYTIRIVLKEEPTTQSKKIPIEYVMAICVLIVFVVIFALICSTGCFLRYRVKKKRRKKKEKSKELALYNDANVRASPITRSGETLSTIGDDASAHKANGVIFNADPPNIRKTSTTVVETGRNSSIPQVFYPYCNNNSAYTTTEPNPDLINDTGKKDRKLQNYFENMRVMRVAADDKYGGERGVVAFAPKTANNEPMAPAEKLAYTAAMSQCHQEDTRGWICGNDAAAAADQSSNCIRSVPVSVAVAGYNRFTPRDIHSTPEKFIVDCCYASAEYGLPKLPTHFPPVLPATAFYRTLPHRRNNAASSNTPCTAVHFAREAEVLTHSVHPASYEHFHGGDVRYNLEGYPKDDSRPSYAPTTTYTSHVSFSDTVQILGKSSNSSVESTSNDAQTGADHKERLITVSLINASAQTQHEDLQPDNNTRTNKKVNFNDDTSDEMKPVKPRRLSVCVKNFTDSPDEGYVGDCTDTTDV